MSELIELLFKITSDECLFYFLQISLVLTFLIALANESIAQYKSGKGSVTLSVERGDESMAKFYGAYIAINSLLVAICLSVDVIQRRCQVPCTLYAVVIGFILHMLTVRLC